MPNWMSNDLQFTGSSETLHVIRDSGFDFNSLYPRPNNITDDDWYDSHWGSSAAGYIDISGDDTTLNIWCRTAWKPPYGLLMYLTKRFVGLRITHKYTEEMCQTVGYGTYENGSVSLKHFHPESYKPSVLRALDISWFDAADFLRFVEDMGCDLHKLEENNNEGPINFIEFVGTHEEFIEIIEKGQREEKERQIASAKWRRENPIKVSPVKYSRDDEREIMEPIAIPKKDY